MRVLFVDDDRNVLSGLNRILRKESFTTLSAESAESALLLLASEEIDVIVADDRMPGMFGTELLHRVREAKPDVLRILMTGHADFETAMRAINQGEVFRFLTKPCHPEDLIAALHAAIRERELLLENRRLVGLLRRRHGEVCDIHRGAMELRDVLKDESGAIVIGGVLEDISSIVHEMEREVAEAERRLAEQEVQRRKATRRDRAA